VQVRMPSVLDDWNEHLRFSYLYMPTPNFRRPEGWHEAGSTLWAHNSRVTCEPLIVIGRFLLGP